MRQVKRNGESRYPVRSKPLGGKPNVRLKAYATCIQLMVKPFDMRFDERTFDADRQIANASVQESFVGDDAPFESRRHSRNCSDDQISALESFCRRLAIVVSRSQSNRAIQYTYTQKPNPDTHLAHLASDFTRATHEVCRSKSLIRPASAYRFWSSGNPRARECLSTAEIEPA